MSININVGGLNYNQLSVAERTEIEKRRKNRLTLVSCVFPLCLATFIEFFIDFSVHFLCPLLGQRTIQRVCETTTR